jgi:hypothetical protein
MATLLLSEPSAVDAVERLAFPPRLRSWMGQDWAVLFLHPDDFVSRDLELDRWVTLAREPFERNGVRPLALARGGQAADAGWVTQVSGGFQHAGVAAAPVVAVSGSVPSQRTGASGGYREDSPTPKGVPICGNHRSAAATEVDVCL